MTLCAFKVRLQPQHGLLMQLMNLRDRQAEHFGDLRQGQFLVVVEGDEQLLTLRKLIDCLRERLLLVRRRWQVALVVGPNSFSTRSAVSGSRSARSRIAASIRARRPSALRARQACCSAITRPTAPMPQPTSDATRRWSQAARRTDERRASRRLRRTVAVRVADLIADRFEAPKTWPEWMSVETAAAYLDVSPERLHKLKQRGHVPFVQTAPKRASSSDAKTSTTGCDPKPERSTHHEQAHHMAARPDGAAPEYLLRLRRPNPQVVPVLRDLRDDASEGAVADRGPRRCQLGQRTDESGFTACFASTLQEPQSRMSTGIAGPRLLL